MTSEYHRCCKFTGYASLQGGELLASHLSKTACVFHKLSLQVYFDPKAPIVLWVFHRYLLLQGGPPSDQRMQIAFLFFFLTEQLNISSRYFRDFLSCYTAPLSISRVQGKSRGDSAQWYQFQFNPESLRFCVLCPHNHQQSLLLLKMIRALQNLELLFHQDWYSSARSVEYF